MTKQIQQDNYKETVYGNSYLLGKHIKVDGKARILNVPFDEYLRELNFIDHSRDVHNIAVVWYEKDEEIYIHMVYDNDSGEVYWAAPSEDGEWTDEDDELASALLMWADLETNWNWA